MRAHSRVTVQLSQAPWFLAFTALALYVAIRLDVFALSVEIVARPGAIGLPNTFASVDHPFHVARADTLWRELASGHVLRWIGQHQGGYPVEFYPLGVAWLEVLLRGLSLGTLSAQGAHTLVIAALFLLPGAAFATLARIDGQPLAVGLLALVFHVSFPGGWYHGGYTELVQWGLATNVAGAVAALLALPALVRFLQAGDGRVGALAAALSAWAVYCNPRSLVGVGALAVGAWVAVTTMPSADGSGVESRGIDLNRGLAATRRLALVIVISVLLTAPLLMALARFGGLYEFVHYSGYERMRDYAVASVDAVSWPVLALGVVGLALGLASPVRLATRAASVSLVVYALGAMAIAFVPWLSRLAPQLEPTRLMPLQRYLVIYLAAVAVWTLLDWLTCRFVLSRSWAATVIGAGISLLVLVTQTRPIPGPPLDPAASTIPGASLYSVTMSAQPEQLDLEMAVRAADAGAQPGTALLVLGSALSWHQQLWAPLWTRRPLFYDNWLWYWRPDHIGTPGYRFAAGHHYPDPELAFEAGYLERHGIGGVVVTGAAREAASRSPLLTPVRAGMYDAYTVRDPVTVVTFGGGNAALLDVRNQSITAVADTPAVPVLARVNWHPRWQAKADGQTSALRQTESGYLQAAPAPTPRTAEFVYSVQPLDWAARLLALVGAAGLVWMARSNTQPGTGHTGWYARQAIRDGDARGVT